MQNQQAVKLCPRCLVRKQLCEFGRCASKRDRLATYCRECYRMVHREHYARRHDTRAAAIRQRYQRQRAENQRVAFAYLQTHPCVDCAEKDPVVLEFDHVRGEKRATVEQIIDEGWSVASLCAEIEKCEVRCANCHRRKTARERGYARYRLSEDLADDSGCVREVPPSYGRRPVVLMTPAPRTIAPRRRQILALRTNTSRV